MPSSAPYLICSQKLDEAFAAPLFSYILFLIRYLDLCIVNPVIEKYSKYLQDRNLEGNVAP
jgi:hypothetical protein